MLAMHFGQKPLNDNQKQKPSAEHKSSKKTEKINGKSNTDQPQDNVVDLWLATAKSCSWMIDHYGCYGDNNNVDGDGDEDVASLWPSREAETAAVALRGRHFW